jgi:hypothetical protein
VWGPSLLAVFIKLTQQPHVSMKTIIALKILPSRLRSFGGKIFRDDIFAPPKGE